MENSTAQNSDNTAIPQKKVKMLGEYLIDLKLVTREDLELAIKEQKEGLHPGLRVGDVLQHKGIITRAQLDQAIELQMVDQYS